MNVREMLELAARAVGLLDEPHEWRHGMLWLLRPSGSVAWNPLNDVGDRYRLAKLLDICIYFGRSYVTYIVGEKCELIRWPEDVPDDAHAIVRAAAEIGLQHK